MEWVEIEGTYRTPVGGRETKKERKKEKGERRAVVNEIEAGLCGSQLSEVMDAHFSAAVLRNAR